MFIILAFDEIPDIDFGEDASLEKAEKLFEQREKLNTEKRIKKEHEKEIKRGSVMIVD